MSEPIMEFKSTKQAVECLKEWQERLGLGDWIIKVRLVKEIETVQNCSGYVDWQEVSRCGVIQIQNSDPEAHLCVKKHCAERVLIHELLHMSFGMIEKGIDKSHDSFQYKAMHKAMDTMADALIMAKYGLKMEFFNNITYEEDETDGQEGSQAAGAQDERHGQEVPV